MINHHAITTLESIINHHHLEAIFLTILQAGVVESCWDKMCLKLPPVASLCIGESCIIVYGEWDLLFLETDSQVQRGVLCRLVIDGKWWIKIDFCWNSQHQHLRIFEMQTPQAFLGRDLWWQGYHGWENYGNHLIGGFLCFYFLI